MTNFSVLYLKNIRRIMLIAFTSGTFTLVTLLSFFVNVYTENQNETTELKIDNDVADSSPAFAGNITANFSVSPPDLNYKNFVTGSSLVNSNISVSDKGENQEPITSSQNVEQAIELNVPKNLTIEPIKMLREFRPSPPLETYFEFNKIPVKPAFPEPKMVRNYGQVKAEGGAFLREHGEQPRNLNFEPGFSAFGSGNFQTSERFRGTTAAGSKNGSPWNVDQRGSAGNQKNEYKSDTPWVSRVRFPSRPIVNENPYPYVSNSGPGQNYEKDPPYSVKSNNNLGPLTIKKNQYFPSLEDNSGPSISTNSVDNSKNSFDNLNPKRGAPSGPSYGITGEGTVESKNRYLPSSYGSSGPNEQFNFNKFVEVRKPQFTETSYKQPSHDKTYEPSYNLMEKPPFEHEHEHKTYGGELSHFSPWKKILKLFATFIPIGLLISALTPTVISVSNVNDTYNNNNNNNLPPTRYRSNENSRKELTERLISSLDYFDKLNENGCEYRVFCELLVSASHMPNSEKHVDNLLENFAKQEKDYKSRAEELRKVFEAVRNHDCTSISCELIKNPT